LREDGYYDDEEIDDPLMKEFDEDDD